jgi:hypothetical protein
MAKFGPTPRPIDIERLESIAAMGGTNEQIADAIGLSPKALQNRRKRDPAVEGAVKRGKDKADLQVVAALYKKALAGDTTAMIFWLKNRRPEEWRDRHDLEHSGKIKTDGKLTIEVIKT